MPQRRKKWRPPLGTVFSGIIGAAIATLMAIAPLLMPQLERRDLAVDMQQEFRKHGLQYAVATAGAEDAILRIAAPSMTEPFAKFLLRDPAKAEQLGKLGFTTVVFANAHGGSWTYDLSQRRFQ